MMGEGSGESDQLLLLPTNPHDLLFRSGGKECKPFFLFFFDCCCSSCVCCSFKSFARSWAFWWSGMRSSSIQSRTKKGKAPTESRGDGLGRDSRGNNRRRCCCCDGSDCIRRCCRQELKASASVSGEWRSWSRSSSMRSGISSSSSCAGMNSRGWRKDGVISAVPPTSTVGSTEDSECPHWCWGCRWISSHDSCPARERRILWRRESLGGDDKIANPGEDSEAEDPALSLLVFRWFLVGLPLLEEEDNEGIPEDAEVDAGEGGNIPAAGDDDGDDADGDALRGSFVGLHIRRYLVNGLRSWYERMCLCGCGEQCSTVLYCTSNSSSGTER